MSDEVEIRSLRNDMVARYLLTVPLTAPDAKPRLLEAAAQLIRERDPGAVDLCGVFWREPEDELVLIMTMEDPK